MTFLPYPEPRYHGASGTQSARLRRADTPPELTTPSGTRVGYLATGTDTDGQLGLYRYDMGPAQGGPGPHFHRSITESFYVLAGQVQLHDGTGWVEAGPGDFLYVAQGGVHGFRNHSGAPASMLILFTPGAPREGYFERVSETGQMSEEERAEFYLRHDTFWV